jgi:hypothetical protein
VTNPHPTLETASQGRPQSAIPQKSASACGAQTILRALGPHDRARRIVLDAFKSHGADLDRWHLRETREAMLASLLAAEDIIERDVHGRPRPYDSADRRDLRHVRRVLETELWP